MSDRPYCAWMQLLESPKEYFPCMPWCPRIMHAMMPPNHSEILLMERHINLPPVGFLDGLFNVGEASLEIRSKHLRYSWRRIVINRQQRIKTVNSALGSKLSLGFCTYRLHVPSGRRKRPLHCLHSSPPQQPELCIWVTKRGGSTHGRGRKSHRL